MYIVRKRFTFSAAHVLPRHKGKCHRLHGHNYAVEVEAASESLNSQGFVVDFGDLKETFQGLFGSWDHRLLVAAQYAKFDSEADTVLIEMADGKVMWTPKDSVVSLPVPETSAENLARYILETMARAVVNYSIVSVRVWETETSCATYQNPIYDKSAVERFVELANQLNLQPELNIRDLNEEMLNR